MNVCFLFSLVFKEISMGDFLNPFYHRPQPSSNFGAVFRAARHSHHSFDICFL
jgi:hypothetical protein